MSDEPAVSKLTVASGAASLSVSLRPIAPADHGFLHLVYAATRQAELDLVDWDDSQKAAFVDMQFEAQHRYYLEQYRGGSFQVITVGDCPAGRLYLAELPGETRIIDIALLPGFRGRGVGTCLVSAVMANAAATNLSVTIHVEHNNPALGWWQRLGFTVAEDRGVHLFLRWQPEPYEP